MLLVSIKPVPESKEMKLLREAEWVKEAVWQKNRLTAQNPNSERVEYAQTVRAFVTGPFSMLDVHS